MNPKDNPNRKEVRISRQAFIDKVIAGNFLGIVTFDPECQATRKKPSNLTELNSMAWDSTHASYDGYPDVVTIFPDLDGQGKEIMKDKPKNTRKKQKPPPKK